MTQTATPGSLASVRRLLPQSAQAMAALIGDELTLRLIAVCGGCTVRVPVSASGPAVARLIGKVGCEHLARRLMFFFAGETLYVPRCAAALDALRAVEIHRAAAAGQSAGRSMVAVVAELARHHGLSDRAIIATLARPAPLLEDGQP